MRTSQAKKLLIAGLVTASAVSAPNYAVADEGGISVYLPGFYGSFAAAPTEPGWAMSAVYYHTSVDAGANQAFPRGGRGEVDLGIDGRSDAVFFVPTYTFAEPILGDAQASLGLLVPIVHGWAQVDATLTGPLGNTVSGQRSDSLTAFGDVAPFASLKWNDGVNNYMAYTTVSIPVGSYDADRIVNTGFGHAAIDSGVGYTYLNPSTGREFTIVGGMTYNFENPHTDYTNGVDGHIDWAASQFFNEHLHAGLVGYAFQQLTGDSGDGAVLGDFKSRVFAVGPQIGYKFDVTDATSGYVNLKGFYEFGAKNRPEGWNVWLTLNFSPAASKHPD
ncbi:SphA family protein [Sinorhizobium meliloti]|uniref:SphA family protein n=1 Tax=Rhizobium meliloti TaxID=382 RepID=UPI000FD85586|nr:transporter [Sinorhizobium meliloti]MDW9830368.1 phenol degradation protein meta [Sinorhizobium meliloti]RVG24803.1 phenol degradation protein meta [Sinorhizobium meliloti]